MTNSFSNRPSDLDDEHDYLEYDGWSDDVDQPALTLTAEQQTALVAAIDRSLDEHGCDNTLRAAKQWAVSAGVDWSTLQAQLEGNGGYCDCEVLFNVIVAPDDEPEPD
jgi:hypothetical protein